MPSDRTQTTKASCGGARVDPRPARPKRRPSAASLLWMLLAGLALVPAGAAAQSWKYVDVVRYADLEFGAVGQNDGEVLKARTDPYIAKFKVTAKLPGTPGAPPSVNLYFDPPSLLQGHQGASVPYTMLAAYNAHEDDPYTATEIHGTSASIDLAINEGHDGQGPPAYSAYVYVYGYVHVGSQPAGSYAGDLALTVEERYPPGWADGGWSDEDDDDLDDGDRHKNDEGQGHEKDNGGGHDKDHE